MSLSDVARSDLRPPVHLAEGRFCYSCTAYIWSGMTEAAGETIEDLAED